MRILMTTDTVGGVWTYSLDLIAALEPYCCNVTLATMGTPLRRAQRADVERLRNVELRESTYRLEWMEDPWSDVDEAGEWLLELAEEQPYDLVHLNNYCHGNLPWTMPIAMVGHSCVWSWHHAVRGTAPADDWKTYYDRVRSGLQAADLVITPTHAMRACLVEHYGPLDNTLVIHNSRALQPYAPALKEPFILTAGRLWDAAKNVEMLTRIANDVTWPIHVAGDATHPDGGTREIPGVRVLGQLERAQLARVMSHAAIYVAPAKYEPFGLSVLEAALSGCALVLSDLASLREVWGDHALFVDPDSPAEWTRVINELAGDMHLRARYASRARERALQLTPECMAEEYYRAYQRLAGVIADSADPASDLDEKDAAACVS